MKHAAGIVGYEVLVPDSFSEGLVLVQSPSFPVSSQFLPSKEFFPY